MDNTLKNILFLTGGLVAGAATGILTAPKSGKETRDDIMDEINSLKEKISHLAGSSKSSIDDQIEELKSSLKDMEAQIKN